MVQLCRLFSARVFLQNKILSENIFNMSGLSRVTLNNQTAREMLDFLRVELSVIKTQVIDRRKIELREENGLLQKEVKSLLSKLTSLEAQNGKGKVPISGQSNVCAFSKLETINPNVIQQVEELASQPKEKKLKKEKPSQMATTQKPSAPAEGPIDVSRLDFRIGKIVEVSKHPDADSLYLEKIECGEPDTRTVVSGLVKFVSLEEMQNRMVVLLCNLKPAKMRGITSEAMVMCASTPDKVEVLTPPNGAVPGDLVYCNGYERKPDVQLNPKKKIFETCAPDLRTNEHLVACYKESPLHVPGKGNVVATSLKNVAVK